jgi:hypothetical protein
MFVWYAETPAHWIRATIISDMLGIVSAQTYDGRRLDGLHKRRVADAVILFSERRDYER